MAIIVLHKTSGIRYVLVGTGYGTYSSSNSSFMLGDLFPNETFGESQLAALSDASGCIIWIPTEELQVLEIDGETVGQLLQATPQSNGGKGWRLQVDPSVSDAQAALLEMESCPACEHRVASDVKECPSCGLTLISEE